MEVLESALLAELAATVPILLARAVVDAAAERGAGAAVRDEAFSASLQALLRGKEGRLDAAAVASSARHFLAGFKALFLCCAEVDRVAAVATDDDMDVDVDAATEDMDVDGRPTPGAQHRQEGSGRNSCASEGSVAVLFPSTCAKRKRASGSGAEVDTVPRNKRRVLAWMRPHQWLPSGSGRVSSAPRRSRHAQTVARALARSRSRRPIGKPKTRTVALAIQRRRSQAQPSLGQHFSQITLSA